MNDPVADFERYDANRERELRKFPVCCICKEHIQQDYAVRYQDRWICDDCLDELREETLDEF